MASGKTGMKLTKEMSVQSKMLTCILKIKVQKWENTLLKSVGVMEGKDGKVGKKEDTYTINLSMPCLKALKYSWQI